MADKDSIKAEVQTILNSARTSAQNFDFNAILRGAQLTVVGALRALQNPALFQTDIYKQAAIAIAAGIVIRLLVEIPVVLAKITLWILSFFINLDAATWDDTVLEGLGFITNVVLQLPFFLMQIRQIIPIGPSLDDMFLMSLKWVDDTYAIKHRSEDPGTLRAPYFETLSRYPTHGGDAQGKKAGLDAFLHLVSRFGRRAALSLGIYLASLIPLVGWIVLPSASFYTFRKAVGPVPAGVIFAVGLLLPRTYLATFLQSYYASRTLMRELLQPYLKRVRFTKEQQKQFFKDREGVLFGFGVGFYIFLKTPLLGVLIYGIAEASTAYLITKITEPPPPPAERESYARSQVRWENKKDFMRLPVLDLDASNVEGDGAAKNPVVSTPIGKKYS